MAQCMSDCLFQLLDGRYRARALDAGIARYAGEIDFARGGDRGPVVRRVQPCRLGCLLSGSPIFTRSVRVVFKRSPTLRLSPAM
jgi:hypothetical protein